VAILKVLKGGRGGLVRMRSYFVPVP